MRRFVILMVLLVLSSSASASRESSVPQELVASVNNFSTLISDGFEVEMQREYMQIPIEPKDRWSAAANWLVFISFEGRGGSNTFTQWVALFSSTSREDFSEEYVAMEIDRFKKWYLVDFVEVGGKMWRVLDFSEAVLKNNIVDVPCEIWTQKDPGCCPSGEGMMHIKLKNGSIAVE